MDGSKPCVGLGQNIGGLFREIEEFTINRMGRPLRDTLKSSRLGDKLAPGAGGF